MSTVRGYRLRVTCDDAWKVELIGDDGSLLVEHSGYSASDALHEVADFLEDEAERGFPVGTAA